MHCTRSAYTLIEILVVLVVIAALAALTLGVVRSSREAARAATCKSHLHQIGLATQNYATMSQVLPRIANGRGFSFFAAILPGMDQAALFNSINFGRTDSVIPDSVANVTAGKTVIAGYLCPSDGSPAATHRLNYSINNGYGFDRHGDLANGAGDLGYLGYAAFADGLSATVLASEALFGSPATATRDPRRSIFRVMNSYRQASELPEFAAACRGLDPATAPLAETSRGRSWMTPHWGCGIYNHNLAPNDHTCLNGSLDFPSGAWTANSQHPDGVNVLFVDGHVGCATGAVDLATWRAISTRAGGEVVAESF